MPSNWSKITRHVKKQRYVIHSQERKSLNRNRQRNDRDFGIRRQVAITNIPNLLEDLKENMRREIEEIFFLIQMEFIAMKNTTFKRKTLLSKIINRLNIAEIWFINLKT